MLLVYPALTLIDDLKYIMIRLSFWLNSLVSLAVVAIISGMWFQSGAIAQSQSESEDWSTLYHQAENYDSRQQYREA